MPTNELLAEVQFLKDQLAALTAENARLRERLAKAEGLLHKVKSAAEQSAPLGNTGDYSEWCGLCDGYQDNHKKGCLVTEIKTFLAPTPAEPAEMVMVRWEDLEEILAYDPLDVMSKCPAIEVYKRLQAAQPRQRKE